jgi:hypothetical protein
VSTTKSSVGSRAREVAGEVLGATDDACPLDGGALNGVRGQHVGVLEMLGHIRSTEPALGAGVGAHEDVLLDRVDGDHPAAHDVIDSPLAVVATRDDPVADRELVAADVDPLTQAAVAP